MKRSERVIERRSIPASSAAWQFRDNPDGTFGVRGYAAVFDSPAHGEVIKRTAFNRTLAQNDNVRFLLNHNADTITACSAPPAGFEPTMTLGVDDRGLWFDVPSLDIEDDSDARRIASKMRRGLIHQCSFSGYWRDAPVVKGVCEVREVELLDVSVVVFPWYEDTEASLTGDRDVDRLLVQARSLDGTDPVELTPEQRVTAARELGRAQLRMAPPGKESWGDITNLVWDELERTLDTWVYLKEIGNDWLVYRAIDMATYEYGPHMQCTWKRSADGTITFGAPFEVKPEYNPVTTTTTESKSFSIAEARALLAAKPAR